MRMLRGASKVIGAVLLYWSGYVDGAHLSYHWAYSIPAYCIGFWIVLPARKEASNGRTM
jgi:hypothetical protein